MPANNNPPRLPNDLYALTTEDIARFKHEASLGMVAPQQEMLRHSAARIDEMQISSQRVQEVVLRLFEVAEGQRSSRHADKRKGRGMVGLAAPQLGIGLRIVVIDTEVSESRKSFGRLECFINPEIMWRSRETAEGREGCFSTGPVWGVVRRPIAVKVRAFGPDGTPLERIFEGFTARIAQHEIDHLDGVRFPDRIKSVSKRHWVHAEELEAYTKQYRQWPRTCSLERWQAYRDAATDYSLVQ